MVSKTIKIVTDSVADIPPDLRDRWQISLIPTFVNYDGESYADDGEQLDRAAYYSSLDDMDEFPTTSAPSPGLAEEILGEASEGYDHIIAVHLPEALSSTINSVRLAVQNLPNPERFTVLDGTTLSMGLGFQVLAAAETAAGTDDVDAVIDAIKRVQDYQQTYAAFATMTYLRRSGRVNALVAFAGTLLQIKPIVSLKYSEITPLHRIRTFKKATAKLHDLIRQEAPLDKLAILHIRNEDGAHALLESLSDIAPPDTPIVEVNPSLGTHIGPGSLGASVLTADWRQ